MSEYEQVGWFKPYDGPYKHINGPWVFIPFDDGPPGPGWVPALVQVDSGADS